MSGVIDLATHPIHLGLGARSIVQPVFSGDMSWYQAYGARHGDDGAEGRLVALHTMNESWTSWEVHPHGEELVIVTAGSMTLIQEIDGTEKRLSVDAGQAAINPAGVWHTADIEKTVTVLFVTPGLGTDHRPR